jgi:Leg1
VSSAYSDQLAQLEFYRAWSALPVLKDALDPFDFSHRLAAYKLLIEATNQRGIFGKENEYNLFWGYVFQLDWQWRSGRLNLADTPPERIDPNSMWGYANYSLSIIPLIAAMQVGLMPELEILSPYTKSAVEYASGGGKAGEFHIPVSFQRVVQGWQEFYRQMDRIAPGGDLEPLRFEQWKAHGYSLTSIEHAVHTVGSRYHAKGELDFLVGWIRMVDFLGAAAWRTDLVYMIKNGVGTLPGRIITEQDVPGKIADMDEQVNGNVRNIIGLTRQSKLQFGFNLWLWKRAMRSRQARDEVLPMLDATFNPSPKNANERRKLLRYMMKL